MMKLKRTPPRTVQGLLEKDHRTTFQKLNRFYEVLNRLRYEGKINIGRNTADVRALVAYFEKELKGHIREEERVLFPFLRRHIPRLEPMVCLLLSEHDDFRQSLQSLKESLSKNKRKGLGSPAAIDAIRERGTYLIFLLRSHMRCESLSLYRAADGELHANEKRELMKYIKNKGRIVA